MVKLTRNKDMARRVLNGEDMISIAREYCISPVTVRRKVQDIIHKVENPVSEPAIYDPLDYSVVHVSILAARERKSQLIPKIRALTAQDYQWQTCHVQGEVTEQTGSIV